MLNLLEPLTAPLTPLLAASEDLPAAIRLIAFYLPQYHPVRENDEWWGKGFTEWTNVTKAVPRFRGHYQPHRPADLGFYDLRLAEAREAQAELAQAYGIHGFCYYHYWFNGRRILERPFDSVLASGQPRYPFCLCWANENWTKRWDGADEEVLLTQNYAPEDDLAHITSLFPAFEDDRYIRVNGKPLFLVYHTKHLPDAAKTAEVWREAVQKAGIGEIYLVRVESREIGVDPRTIGFDAAVEFAPDWSRLGPPLYKQRPQRWLRKVGLLAKPCIKNHISEYDALVENMLRKPEPDYKRFLGVAPSWDNSARRASGAMIVRNSSPLKYEHWLRRTAIKTEERFEGDERMIFINAWNEWAEGAHLEPDQKFGRQYLEATRRVSLQTPT